MRKMKKVLSLAMTAAMTASLLTGMGAVTASAKKSDDGKRTKITALLKGTESTEQYKTLIHFQTSLDARMEHFLQPAKILMLWLM